MELCNGASLVLGGARSGKSAFAERLILETGRKPIYLATSRIWDDEMEGRVVLHQERRGPEWQVVEEPLALREALAEYAKPETTVLVDCLTLWLTNLMMEEQAVDVEADALVSGLVDLPDDAQVLFVSNEVGLGIVPMDKMARDFRDHAGRLHQAIAALATNVWFVTAGLPQQLK